MISSWISGNGALSWIMNWNSTENRIYADSWFETQKQMTNSPKDWIYFFFTSWIEIWKKTTNSTENWIYAESWFETQKQMTNSPKDWIYFFFYIALRETDSLTCAWRLAMPFIVDLHEKLEEELTFHCIWPPDWGWIHAVQSPDGYFGLKCKIPVKS